MHGGHGKPRAGVEAPGALAGAAPAHEVPLAGEDDAGDELPRLGSHAALEREPELRRIPASRLPDEAGYLGRSPRPRLGSGAVLLSLVRAGRVGFRNGVLGVRLPRFLRGPLHTFVEQVSIGRPTRVAAFFPAGLWRLAGNITTSLVALRHVTDRRRAVLEAFEQGLECPVLHRFEARERQRGLVAYRKEDHRVPGRCGLQFVVEQPLVEDADVLGGEVGEVHRHDRPGAAPALPDPNRGAGEELQHLVDVAVRERLALEAGGLEDG